MSKITFHHDGGHGWYEVPLLDVRKSGAKISPFSYANLRQGIAYLEEDCDITAFVAAIGGKAVLQERYGDIPSVYDGDDSPIRSLCPWPFGNTIGVPASVWSKHL
jgi:hypothetical protein